MFCDIFIKMKNVDSFSEKNIDFFDVKKMKKVILNCQNIQKNIDTFQLMSFSVECGY